MFEVAERMSARYCADDTLKVSAARRNGLLSVTEGIEVADNWTDVFEPVRKRRRFTTRWTPIQSVQEAASQIGQFLRERPDLRAL